MSFCSLTKGITHLQTVFVSLSISVLLNLSCVWILRAHTPGTAVCVHTLLEQPSACTHSWNSRLHAHTPGTAVCMHTLVEQLSACTHSWNSCLHAHTPGTAVCVHTLLEQLSVCTHSWNSCLHAHTPGTAACTHKHSCMHTQKLMHKRGVLLSLISRNKVSYSPVQMTRTTQKHRNKHCMLDYYEETPVPITCTTHLNFQGTLLRRNTCATNMHNSPELSGDTWQGPCGRRWRSRPTLGWWCWSPRVWSPSGPHTISHSKGQPLL